MMRRGLVFALSFVLLFSVSTLAEPLSEGFEGTFPPDGWTIIQGPCSPTNDIIQTSDEAHTGTYSLRFSSYYSCGDGYDEYIITPRLDVTSGDQTISFWYKKYSSGTEVFNVGWSSTGTDVSTDFTWTEDITDATTDWQQYTKTDLPVGTKYVAVHYHSNFSYYLYIDDFAGPELYVSTDSVDWCNLQWPPSDTITEGDDFWVYAQCWEDGVTNYPGPGTGIESWIGWSDADIAPNSWTNWEPGTYNTDVDNNDEYKANLGAILSPGAYYYASRFRLNDGPYTYGGYSAGGGGFWDGTTYVSGYLLVNPFVVNTFPWTEGFEDETFPPAHWSTMGTGWDRTTSYYHTGDASAMCNWTAGNWLITPAIDLSGGDYRLTFWGRHYSSPSGEFNVVVSENADMSDSTVIESWANIYTDWTDEFQPFTISLSAYSDTVYIGFNFESLYGCKAIIDDITIEEIPTTPQIVISQDTFDIGFVEVGTTDSVEIIISNTGGADLVITSATVSAPFSCTYSGTIAPGESDTTYGYFSPTSTGDYSEELTFNIDGAFTGDNSCQLEGYGYPAGLVCQDFTETDFPPAGWDTLNFTDYASDGWSRYESSTYSRSLPACAKGNPGTDSTNFWLVTPRLSVRTGDIMFFWYRTESAIYDESFAVYITTGSDWRDTTGYTQIWDSGIINNTTYQSQVLSLSAYEGQEVYIAFKHYYGESGSWFLFLDDIYHPPIYVPLVDVSPAHISPADTTVESGEEITYSAYIRNLGGDEVTDVPVEFWVEGPGAYVYSDSDTVASIPSADSVLVTFNWTPPDISGFYDISVITALTGDGDASNDTTAERAFVYVSGCLFESFENETFPPEGWSTATDVPGKEWERSTSYSYHEDASAKAPWSSSGVTADLTTPQILPEVDDSISFYLRGNSYSSCTLRVIADDITDGTTDTLDKICTGFGTDWTRFAYDLSTYDGDVVTITFSQEDHNGFYVYLDCVTGPMIYVPPIDVSPTDLFFSSPPMTGEDVDVSLEVVNIGTDVPDSIIIEFGKGASVYLIDTLVGVFATSDTDTVAFTHSWTVSDSFLNDYWAMATAYYPVDENVGNDTLTSSVFVLPTGIVMYEDFEDDWSDTAGIAPPGPWEIYPGWNVWDYGDAADAWNGNDWHRLSPTKSEVTNGTNVASVWYSPVENQDEWLVSPSIEGNAHTTWLVGLWMNYDDFGLSDSDTGFVDITTDGGTSWSNIATFTEDILDTDTSFDISSLVAYHWFQIRFRYVGDNAWGWQVDNVMIRGFGPAEVGEENAVVKQFSLGNAYPNPFNPTVTISYALKGCSSDIYKVELDVYNLLGKKVRTLVSCEQSGGRYRIIWDGKDEVGNTVPSGVYLYRLKAGDFVSTKKMMMLK